MKGIRFRKGQDVMAEKAYDIFICSASFEERSFSFVKEFHSEFYLGKSYVVRLVHNQAATQKSLGEICTKINPDIVIIDDDDQVETAKLFASLFNGFLSTNKLVKILIDISTFTRQALLILFRVIRSTFKYSNCVVNIVYSMAEEYCYNEIEENKWLSRGVKYISSVLGYAGTMNPSSPHHLIILMGFEVERAAALIYEYEPSVVSIGIASCSSSNSVSNYNLNLKRCNLLREEFPFLKQFEFTCNSIEECIKEVVAIAESVPNHNVVISPMHNKVSTLACAFATYFGSDYQIALSKPLIYNTEAYSKLGDSFLFFESSLQVLKAND